jgi:hypothetical protein
MKSGGKHDGLRIDLDLEHARREGERVRTMLEALRRRHDLSRFEYTQIVRIVPGGDTFSHPILTLGNRFADSEDLLLSTYLHEQMHWYLWHLGTPDSDPLAPFFDELVRRYPEAPTELPDGARNYQATYTHLVVNWLEVAATAQFIGQARAFAIADAQRSYRWIYKTVLRDWDLLGELYQRHGVVPIRSAQELLKAKAKPRRRPAEALNGARRKRPVAVRQPASPRSRRTPRVRDGTSAG